MQVVADCQYFRVAASRLKIVAVFNQLCAQGLHGGIFLTCIACGHHDGGGHIVLAGREGYALTVVATRGRNKTCGHLACSLECRHVR